MIKLFQFQSTFWIWLFIGLIILFAWEALPYPPAVGMRLVLWFIASIVLFILDSDQHKEQTARLQNQVAAAGSQPARRAVPPATAPAPTAIFFQMLYDFSSSFFLVFATASDFEVSMAD